MDVLDRSAQDPATWWIGVTVALAILGLVVWVQHDQPRAVTGERGAYIDPVGGPCHPERWALACSRWVDAGWVCMLGPGGVPVVEFADPTKRGAHGRIDGREVIGLSPDACGDGDPAPEHEVGHLLGLADCPGCPVGDVMGTPHTRAGLQMPRRQP